MEFPPLPSRLYPDQTMDSKFQPVGELDSALLAQAEEVNGFLMPKFLKIKSQIHQNIVNVGHSDEQSLFMGDPFMSFHRNGVSLSDAQVKYFRSFVVNLVGSVRDMTFSNDLIAKNSRDQELRYFLDFFGRDKLPAYAVDPVRAEWHSHYWRNCRASIVHIGLLPMEVLHGQVSLDTEEYQEAVEVFNEEEEKDHFSYEKSFTVAFNNLISCSAKNAIQQGAVSVRTADSGQVACINPLETVHRVVPVNTEAVSVPFLRHEAIYFHPRNVVPAAV